MRIGVIGTGVVGRTLAQGFASTGHDVAIGTRDVGALMARSEPDTRGNPPFAIWHADHSDVQVLTLAAAAEHAELVVNATPGEVSLAALTEAGAEHLDGKVVLDTSNPIDHASGIPFTLFVANTDSLAEQLQAEFPRARFVKALNTVNAQLMCEPVSLAHGDHTIMLCGNDDAAKAAVTSLLEGFGWSDVMDVGDLTGGRAMESYLTLWIRIVGVLGTPAFNVKVVR